MTQLYLPNGATKLNKPISKLSDSFYAVVINAAKEVLVIEREKPGNSGGVCWQIMSGHLEPNEDPFTAVQQKLLSLTGYQTSHWSYLGSHVKDAGHHEGAGYFFCAQNARPASEMPHIELEQYGLKWVPLTDLRYALLDGRITVMSHALTVSLALLTILK